MAMAMALEGRPEATSTDVKAHVQSSDSAQMYTAQTHQVGSLTSLAEQWEVRDKRLLKTVSAKRNVFYSGRPWLKLEGFASKGLSWSLPAHGKS